MKLLEYMRKERYDYQKKILDSITDFIYRDERYNARFAIMLMCSKEESYTEEIFEKILRKTDLHIKVDKHIDAVVFDSVTNDSYIKAAENIEYSLQKEKQSLFFISVVDSENYKNDYFPMVHELFDILEYAIENNFSNTVMD